DGQAVELTSKEGHLNGQILASKVPLLRGSALRLDQADEERDEDEGRDEDRGGRLAQLAVGDLAALAHRRLRGGEVLPTPAGPLGPPADHETDHQAHGDD